MEEGEAPPSTAKESNDMSEEERKEAYIQRCKQAEIDALLERMQGEMQDSEKKKVTLTLIIYNHDYCVHVT